MSLVEHAFPIEVLTTDKTTTLFMCGISHAQSCTVLFSRLFEYIHALHPEYRVTSDINTFKKSLARQNRPLIYFRLPPNEFQDPWIESGLNYQAELMWRQLNKKSPMPERSRDAILSDLVEELCYEDRQYLVYRRHVKQPALALNYTIREPVVSYVCHYGLEGHSTGSAEFDEIYRDVNLYIQFTLTSLKDNKALPRPYWYDILQELRRIHSANVWRQRRNNKMA